MAGFELDDFLQLEMKVWEALLHGDPEADAAMLSVDFLGVYPTGFADRDEHAAQLHSGPTVSSYSLHDARLLVVAEAAVLLVYRADFRRPSRSAIADSGDLESMYISSLWCLRDGGWINVFSQDTVAGR